MTNLITAEENRLLDLSLPSGQVRLHLYTVAPSDDGVGGTEVLGGAYAAQAFSCGAAVNGAKSNSAAIVFPTASAVWGNVVAYVVKDLAGNFRWYRLLDPPGADPLTDPGEQRFIRPGDVYQVPAGALNFGLD